MNNCEFKWKLISATHFQWSPVGVWQNCFLQLLSPAFKFKFYSTAILNILLLCQRHFVRVLAFANRCVGKPPLCGRPQVESQQSETKNLNPRRKQPSCRVNPHSLSLACWMHTPLSAHTQPHWETNTQTHSCRIVVWGCLECHLSLNP